MPELPEVETIRRGLEVRVVGRRIERVEIGRERTVRRTSRQAVIDGLTGTTVTAVTRQGKYLVCTLDSGDAVLIHLRMSGQLLLTPAETPRPPHTHIAMSLDGEELRFVDPRTFGEVVVFDPARGRRGPRAQPPRSDPLVDGLTTAVLQARLAGRSRPLKSWLLDQHLLAGLGNIYSDEVLHTARLRFDRPAGSLTARQIGALREAIDEVLARPSSPEGRPSATTSTWACPASRAGTSSAPRLRAGGPPCPRCPSR